jgi:23S rRNA (uracil1939-C5)-methyltransferase
MLYLTFSGNMKTGEIFTLRAEHIASSGAAVLHFEGQTIFMDLCAPGDIATGRITADHKTWAEAELVEIQEPSPLRVDPVCPLYGVCGGCSLQHISYEAQIAEKTAILKDAFLHIGSFSPPEPEARESIPLGYRNRIQLHVIQRPASFPFRQAASKRPHSKKSGHPGLKPGLNPGPDPGSSCGFKKRESSSLIPIQDCPVADERIRAAFARGEIRAPAGLDRFTVYGRGDTFLIEGSPSPQTPSRGRVRVLDRELGMDVSVFFQSNAVMLEVLIADLVRIADRADRSLPAADLYCGVGTFAVFLADHFPHLDMAEENKKAVSLARENTMELSAGYFALRDDEWPKFLKGKRYGFMVMDPPRQGLSAGLRDWLCGEGPPLFAYVSCSPASLARDSGELRKAYRLTGLSWYDFYPQTAHIETMAVFERIG